MKQSFLIALFLIGLQTYSCTTDSDQNKIVPASSSVPPIDIANEKGTYLYATKAYQIAGALTKQPGDYYVWEGNSEIRWVINIPSAQKYDVYIIAAIPKTTNNKAATLTFGAKNGGFMLNPTSGPWGSGKNFQRTKVISGILLTQGRQELCVTTTAESLGDSEFYFRALELVPVLANPTIEAEKKRAIDSRASMQWLVQSGYGVMFHWTSQSVNPDGSQKAYADAVNSFDVERFANMVEETGAGYVIFTIGHAEQYCPAPIENWEKLHPGKTTKRDLIGEIANALNSKGIRLICYMHSMGTARFQFDDNETFFGNFKTILHEFGNRYKEKLAGYWFDCWYQISEGFPEIPFEDFYNTTKTGNKDRIICLNSWIYPSVSPWQDYWAGEVASPVAVPEKGFMKGGPAPDLPYQALLIMEPYWVQEKAEMPEPRFKSSELSQYIRNCMNNGGAVTINLGIYQNGTVGEEALEVMKEVRRQIRTGK